MKEVIQNKDGHWEFVKDKFFKADDFGLNVCISFERAAEIANQKLEKYLESCPVVYGNMEHGFATNGKSPWCTHRAHLAFVEPIVKKKCNHTVASHRFDDGPWTFHTAPNGGFVCGKCGVELKAEWKEVK